MRSIPAGIADPAKRHSRTALAVFVALTVIALIAGVWIYHWLERSEEQRIEKTLSHFADIETAAVTNWVEERLSDATVFGGGKFFGDAADLWIERGAPPDDTMRQMREQLEVIKSTYDYLSVSILDGSGNLRITTESGAAIPDADAMVTVNRAIATNRTEVSGFRVITIAGKPRRVIDIATPLLSSHANADKLPTVLLLQASTDMDIEPFIRSLPLFSALTQAVLAEVRDGRVTAVSVSNTDYFTENQPLPVTAATLAAAAQAPTRSFLMKRDNGEEALAVARRVDDLPWYLVATVDRRAVRASLAILAWKVAVVTTGMLALIGVGLLLWWRQRESEFRLRTLRAETERELLQRRYDYLSRYANDMIVLADTDGRILEVNDKTLQVLGRERPEVIGAQLDSLFLPSSRIRLHEELKALPARGAAVFELEKLSTEGTVIQTEASARAIRLEDRYVVQLVCRDITDRKRVESALRESQDRLNRILASILDVVWSFSPGFTRLNYINQSTERVYGYPPEAFAERPQLWLDLIHTEDRARMDGMIRELDPEHRMCDAEYRIMRPDGKIRWLHCRGTLVLDDQGRPLRIDGITTDITQRKETEQQIQLLAYYDSVTMLPNRRLLNDRLAQSLHMALRSQKKVALLYMDLDNFKNINDSLGHHVGDMLLRSIAERLLQCVREEDTVARIGGDEFLVVLPDLEKGGQAVPVAEKILASSAHPFMLGDQQIHTTISIGISVYPDDAKEPAELVQHADSALYQAKALGRNNYQFFTQELNKQITRSSSIERQLRLAIDNGQLSLWYQPQVDARDGRLIGAEALLRWRRDDKEFLSPVEFIPIAEERGLISRIGEWTMREACMQSRRWQAQGLRTVPIAVNVSPIQFQQKDFAALVTGILEETRLDATLLEIEITENSIMRRAPQVAELAMRLREAGVGISIDDFGTGYSNLSYLKQIPIDKIKIDRSFITDMLTDDDDDAITYAIVNLAHSLNLRVLAEGVETKAQIDRLRHFGCDEVQGHFYSSAVSAVVFEQYLSGERSFANTMAQHPA